MSRHAPVSHSSREEIYRLASAMLARDISAAEFQRFEHLVTHDAAACDWYVEFMCDAYNLRTHPKLGPVNTANPPIAVFSSDDNRGATRPAPAPPVLGLLGGAWHGTVGYFSSGWPLAYLVATVIFGVGLLIGSRIPVSQPAQIAEQPLPPSRLFSEPKKELVGRITGMVDCRWVQSPESRVQSPESVSRLSSLVSLSDRFVLSSGLMEITYDTGAKVILQGPVTYEIESPARAALLSVGKLTARLDKRSEISDPKSQVPSPKTQVPNPLFSVRTPTAIVTDLGTEFGVEVSKGGSTTSHVFRGSVKVQRLGVATETEGSAIVLRENESVQTQKIEDPKGFGVVLCRVNVDPAIFVRRVALPVKTIDLRDIVAGNDGRVQHRSRDFTPIQGMEETALVPQAGDGQKLHRFGSADELIDRIFLPDGNQGTVQIDSAGHGFDHFPKTNGNPHSSIDATAAGVPSNAKSMSNDRGLLGLRSNAGITFDLKAMRERYAGVRPTRFRSSVFCGSPAGATTLFQDDFQSARAGTMPRDASLVLLPTIGVSDVGGIWVGVPNTDTTVRVLEQRQSWQAGERRGREQLREGVDGGYDLTATNWAAAATTNIPVEVSFSLWEDSTKPVRVAVAGFVDQLDNESSFTAYFHPNGTVSYYDRDKDSRFEHHLSYRCLARRKDQGRHGDPDVLADRGRGHRRRLHWKYGTSSVNCVYFGCNGPPHGQFFIDNVKITSIAGLTESRRRGFGRDGRGDLWVFVDGRLKLHRMKLRPQDGPIPVDIELRPDDRFLTLVGTGDGTSQLWNWIVFGDPVLEMTSSEGLRPQ